MEPRFLQIAAALGRRRAVRAAGALLLAAGIAAGSLPLLDAPGYELGELGALLAAALAPPLALAAVRIERRRPDPSPAAAFGAAALVLSALLALLFAGGVVRAAVGPCSALTPAAAFFPLLAFPTALLATAVATIAALAARGRTLGTALIYGAVLAGSLAWTLAAAYQGPAAFLFDPLLGAWPGPLYDEAIPVDARLLLFRGEAAAWGAALVALAEAGARARRAGLQSAAAPLVALAVAGGAGIAGRATRDALALSGEREGIARALGGRREGPRCTLLVPAEKPAAATDALLAECEFHADDLARALGLDAPPHVTVTVHRSAAEKRRLVGAAATDFAKPWLGEVHVVDAPSPHPLLRHELVHAVAGAIAGGPLARPGARGRPPVGRPDRGARRRARPPARRLDPPRVVTRRPGSGPPPRRRRDRRAGGVLDAGASPRLHRGGELPRIPDRAPRRGEGGPRLPRRRRLGGGRGPARRARRRVAGVPRRGDRSAGARGRRPRAARSEEPVRAALRARGGGARQQRDGRRWRRAQRGGVRPVAPLGHVRRGRGRREGGGDALARGGDLDGAAAAYADARARAAPEDEALRAALAAAEGDLAWRRGDRAAAERGWAEALAAHPDRPEARLLEAKRAAAADAALDVAARGYLLGEGDPILALARVARVERPLAAYLVGRALLARGEARAALPDLARADAGPLPPVLAAEARVLRAEARCLAGEEDAGAADLAALAAGARGDAERARAEAGLRRCRFESAVRASGNAPAAGARLAP